MADSEFEAEASEEASRAGDWGDAPHRDAESSYRETYCVFEGGGALGALHVGVLRALQNHPERYDLKGFAGASAGAMVALLAAAGFSGERIIGRMEEGRLPTILDELGDDAVRTATDLIGPGWFWIDWARWLSEGRLGAGRFAWLDLKAALGLYAVLLLLTMMIDSRISLALLLIALLAAGGAVYAFRRGIADLSTLHASLHKLIRRRLKIHDNPARPITFRQFERRTGRQLNVVASNLTRRRMGLFSALTTPNACVVDAVVASIAIPGVFRPREVAWPNEEGAWGQAELYCDGGMVSNLPAWSFESAQRLNRNCLIVTSELSGAAEEHPKNPNRGTLAFLGALARTAVFGGSDLNVRGLDRLIRISPNDGKLKVLDFDISAEALAAAVAAAETLAEQRLELERELHAYTAAIRRKAQEALRETLGEPPAPSGYYVRCALAIGGRYRTKDLPFFRLAYCQGFAPFADERARYAIEGSVAGDALKHKMAFMSDLTDPDNLSQFKSVGEDSWAWKLTPPDLKWSLCVPTRLVLDTAEEDGELEPRWVVVTVDSNCRLWGDRLDAVAERITAHILEIDPQT